MTSRCKKSSGCGGEWIYPVLCVKLCHNEILQLHFLFVDILSVGFKYSLRKITFQQSGAPTHQPSTGARTGKQNGTPNHTLPCRVTLTGK